ncbi:carbonic anhydrase [Bacillus sp. REN16]|uniref:carbonic anhydrase n=1 Tax=Bacillus sp. REN16 TaxID=2887296 RepID=UPI001E531138|nr:carbonic anhydrase [Bacillus sp. REN16]MCC3358131.1 carbonic anhydrase [Bacillus sp. REN16]
MYSNEKRKVLFVTETEYKPQNLTQYVNDINPKDMIILTSYGREVLQPFGDLMRDIIVTVYHENIKDIVVVGDKGTGTSSQLGRCTCPSVPQEKLETLEYLFKNCKPEFHGISLREWLEGNKTATDNVQKSADTIRNHPLMPSDVNVHELFINTDTKEVSEEAVF